MLFCACAVTAFAQETVGDRAGDVNPPDAQKLPAQSPQSSPTASPLGTAPFWDDDYVHVWSPAERRQTWASPIRLSDNEANCIGLSFRLRIDAPRDQSSDIVGLAAKKVLNGYELIYLTDQRLGGSSAVLKW